MSPEQIYDGTWEVQCGIAQPYHPTIDQYGAGAFMYAASFRDKFKEHIYNTINLSDGFYRASSIEFLNNKCNNIIIPKAI